MNGFRTTVTLSIVCVCFLVGCAPMAEQIKPEDMSDFRPGVTTQQQVVSRLGTPSSTSRLPDGSTFVVYAFTEPKSLTAIFISNMNPMGGGNNARSSAISFQFGPDGILTTSDTVSSPLGPVIHRQP